MKFLVKDQEKGQMVKHLSDNELIYLYRQGNEEAFEVLSKRYQGMIWNYVRKYKYVVKTSCELSDLHQIANASLQFAIHGFRESIGSPFVAYYKVVMTRNVLNYIRHMSSDMNCANQNALSIDQAVSDHEGIYIVDTIAATDRQSDPKWMFMQQEIRSQMDALMHQLPLQQQEVVALWEQGFSYKEISLLCNVAEKKVDNILHAFKKKIREKLTE